MVARGLAPSRTRARALIEAGLVALDGRTITKPSESVADDAELEITGLDHPWVGRGGVKLAHALDRFGLDPAGRVALDLGASTGGFTDVLLSRGAARVHAVDVGRDQLDPGLRADGRVVVHDGVNARDLDRELVPKPIGALVADLGFVSLTKALGPGLDLAAPGAWLVALVKPQFEVGRHALGKGGIVRDADARAGALATVSTWVADRPGWDVIGSTESPITGGDGNVEFLLAAHRA